MWPTEAPLAVVFASGLLGGLGHCVGMCGPLAATFALRLKGGKPLAPLLLYNLGRVTTYALVGGAVGVAGSLAGVASHFAGIQRAVAAGTGLLIAALGLSMGGFFPRPGRPAGTAPFPAAFEKAVRLFTDHGGPGAYYPLGMILGLLPCGLVYTALLSSARFGMEAPSAAGAFLSGFLVMALFGIGTVPPLLLLGQAASLFGDRARAWLYRAAAALMVVLGILFAVRGLRS